MRLLTFVAIGVVVILASIFAFFKLNPDKETTNISFFEQDSQVIDSDLIAHPAALGDIFVGDVNAPVTMVEYFSLTCPHCKSFHQNIYPKIKADYIDTGKVRFIFRDFPLDNVAMLASVLLRCTPESSYEQVLSTLYTQQREWLAGGQPKKALANLSRFFGMNDEDYQACIERQDILDHLEEQLTLATEAGVSSTPTFFINKQKISNMPYKKMKVVIDEALVEAGVSMDFSSNSHLSK